jgi:hypothetical protein
VLPRLVHSRFGLHVVEVLAREPGRTPAFEAVRGAVAQALRQQAFVTALRQYLQLLAGQAEVHGVALDSADTPLVQWAIVFTAALGGRGGQAPSDNETDAALQRMVESVKAGRLQGLLPFNRAGEPVQFG